MDPHALQDWPFTADATTYKLILADVDDDLALPIGGYFITLVSTEPLGCTIRHGATAVPPTDDSTTAVSGMVLVPGAPFTMTLRVATTMHAIMNATGAVGTLFFTKVR